MKKAHIVLILLLLCVFNVFCAQQQCNGKMLLFNAQNAQAIRLQMLYNQQKFKALTVQYNQHQVLLQRKLEYATMSKRNNHLLSNKMQIEYPSVEKMELVDPRELAPPHAYQLPTASFTVVSSSQTASQILTVARIATTTKTVRVTAASTAIREQQKIIPDTHQMQTHATHITVAKVKAAVATSQTTDPVVLNSCQAPAPATTISVSVPPIPRLRRAKTIDVSPLALPAPSELPVPKATTPQTTPSAAPLTANNASSGSANAQRTHSPTFIVADLSLACSKGIPVFEAIAAPDKPRLKPKKSLTSLSSLIL